MRRDSGMNGRRALLAGEAARRWLLGGLAVAIGLALALPQAVLAHQAPQVQIWSDRGSASVYRIGDCAELHFRPEDNCYVIVYQIDTDGNLTVLFPSETDDDGYVLGGRTYSIWRDGSYRLYVNGPTGVEYVHVLAAYDPFRRIYWQGCRGYENYAREVTWQGFHDYWGSALPARISGDPYAAMQSIDEFICGDALEAGLVWADFTYFYVGERVSYPRYLCYDCHGFDACVRPYSDVCVAFSISFEDCAPCYQPWSWWWWCSPERAYCGPRYVCHGTSYPSEYKWKSRGEGGGFSIPVVERAPVGRGGNAVDAARVQSRDGTRDVDLYARDRAPEVRQRPTQTEREQAGDRSRLEIRERGADKGKGRSLLGSVITKLMRSGGDRGKAKSKGASPQVRTGDKGKSPAARRKLSR